MVKNLSASAGTTGLNPGSGRSPEGGNGTPFQYSCREIPWTEKPDTVHGGAESDMTEQLHFHFSLSHIGGGNSNPLQCSRLENPTDRAAWWATVHEVTESQTRLKRPSNRVCFYYEDCWNSSYCCSFLPFRDGVLKGSRVSATREH